MPKRHAKYVHPDDAATPMKVPSGCAVHTHGDVRIGMGVPYHGWITLSGAGYAWFAPSEEPDLETHLTWWIED